MKILKALSWERGNWNKNMYIFVFDVVLKYGFDLPLWSQIDK